MDCGKSTAIRAMAAGLRERGLRIGAGKVTGFGCLYETTGLNADFCLDFSDYGLPSTCGKDGARVRRTARRILDELRRRGPDVVILEFGEALIGPYRVDEVQSSAHRRHVFVALTFAGRGGTRGCASWASVRLRDGASRQHAGGYGADRASLRLPAEPNRACPRSSRVVSRRRGIGQRS
jgi:hypothetical protein